MKSYFQHIALALLFAARWQMLEAQDFSFTATVNRNSIYANESVKLTLTLTNANGRIALPDMPGWQVISGPSTSNNMTIYNGKMSSSYAETYVLKPLKEGSLTIPEITAKTDKGTLATKPVTVTVQAGNAPQSQPTPPSGPSQVQPPTQAGENDFFIDIKLSKSKVYQGEPVLATYSFYSIYDPRQIEKVDYPVLDGFWTEEIETEPKVETTIINGRRYFTAAVHRVLLFPQVTGTLSIEGFRMSIIATTGAGWWNSRNVRLENKGNTVRIEVMPLPPGKPAGFLGTYSPLDLKVEANPRELKTNEAINLKLTFTGKGNLKLIDKPALQFPADFEKFDPKTKDNITVNASGESGSRSFEYVLIPRVAGSYSIPPVSLSYFDYSTRSYKMLSFPDLAFNVSKGDGTGSGNFTYDNRSEVQLLSQDIRYIKSGNYDLIPRSRVFFNSSGFYALMVLPAVVFLLILLIDRKRQRDEADPISAVRRKALGVAQRHLKAAGIALRNGNRREFHTLLFQSVNQYLSHKLAIPMAELQHQKIKAQLEQRMSADDTAGIMQVLEQVQMAHFAGTSALNDNQLMEQASQLIQKIERP